MSPRTGIRIALVVVVLLVANSAFFVVSETSQVIITQFGDPIGQPITLPGVHMKVPIIQQVNEFDKRFLEWDGNPNQVPTKDKRFIWVDTYARWRIVDPLKFFQRLRDERGAQSRLDDILDGETRNAVARYDLIELVRSTNRRKEDVPVESDEEKIILEPIVKGRVKIEGEILERAAGRMGDLGIELLDIRLKRLNYVEQVQKDVFARMIAERNRIAELFRSEGEGEAARIRGERERELKRIQSEAYRSAEELRGKADAQATDIYAEANGRDPDFYAFTKSLETYERTDGPAHGVHPGHRQRAAEVPVAPALNGPGGPRGARPPERLAGLFAPDDVADAVQIAIVSKKDEQVAVGDHIVGARHDVHLAAAPVNGDELHVEVVAQGQVLQRAPHELAWGAHLRDRVAGQQRQEFDDVPAGKAITQADRHVLLRMDDVVHAERRQDAPVFLGQRLDRDVRHANLADVQCRERDDVHASAEAHDRGVHVCEPQRLERLAVGRVHDRRARGVIRAPFHRVVARVEGQHLLAGIEQRARHVAAKPAQAEDGETAPSSYDHPIIRFSSA